MFDRQHFIDEKFESKLNSIYLELHGIVKKALRDAENNKKKLLILAGEHHSSTYSLLCQTLLILVIKEYQINNLIVEFPEKFVTSMLSAPRNKKTLNTEFSIPFAKFKLDLQIFPGDFDYLGSNLTADKLDQAREEKMIETCCKINTDHALFILGSIHVKPLAERLKKSFHVVALNLSNITVSEEIAFGCMKLLNIINPKILNYGPSDIDVRYNFIKNPKFTTQLTHSFNLERVSQEKLMSAIKKWYALFEKDAEPEENIRINNNL